MRLISLELNDFRSFFGVHRLEFAADDDKRVTIFHGENGAGKTNLLNAVHWCVTGQFTPRFQDKQLLVNKEAFKQGRRECFVELVFREEAEAGGKVYRVRRSATNERQTSFDVFQVIRGNSTVLPKGDSLLRRLLPPGLIGWFFFDAEAIGALELSGSESFKQDLRKTLGFDLVDALLRDLDAVQSKRRREVAAQTNDRELLAIEADIENIDRVLPAQYEAAASLDRERQKLTAELENVRTELAKKPQAEPLEKRRRAVGVPDRQARRGEEAAVGKSRPDRWRSGARVDPARGDEAIGRRAGRARSEGQLAIPLQRPTREGHPERQLVCLWSPSARREP